MIEKDGYRFIVPGWLLTLILALLVLFVSLWLLIPFVIIGILTVFVTCFFRDPERIPPEGDNLILSPGDGKVILIEKQTDQQGKRLTMVSIFLSIFDVHINRIPISGQVVRLVYKPGKFFKAFVPQAATENERMEIDIESRYGTLRFTQVAGILARRVVCRLNGDETVIRGQRFGLIRFGSRVDLYLGENVEIKVSLNDHVKGGESIIGEFKTDG